VNERTHPELHRLARGGSLGIIGLAVSGLLGFIFLKVVSAHFRPSSAGSIFVALSIFAIVSFIAPIGADIGLLRFTPIFRHSYPDREKTLCAMSLLPTLVVSSVLAYLTFRFGSDLAVVAVRHGNRHLMQQELRLLSPFIPFAALTNTSLAGLRGWSIRPAVMIQNVFVPIARVVILIGAAQLVHSSPTSVALSWGLPLVVATVVSLAFLAIRVRADGRLVRDTPKVDNPSTRSLISEFWLFSSARSVQALFVVMVVYLDVILVGSLDSSRAAGVYTIASRYTVLGTTAGQGIAYAFGPQLSSLLHRKKLKEANGIYKTATTWVVMLAWPILLSLAIFSPVYMGIFGNRYRSGAMALTILALAMLLQTVTGNNTVALNMAGKSGANLAIGGVALSVNVGANLWLIPLLGINGAAIAWGITIVITQALTSAVLYGKVGLEPLSAGYAVAIAASVVCFGLVGILIREIAGVSYASLGLAAILGCALYSVILFVNRGPLHLKVMRGLGRTGTSEEPTAAFP